MKIALNLQYLRKRDKITQEALADKLGVSRQSVSKWETGEAYPETDKLLAICDMFNVSLDGLMRDDLSTSQNTDEATDAESATTAKEFVKVTDKLSHGISIGLFLILIGVAVCVTLAGISFSLSEDYAQLTAIMGGVAVIAFTAPAIFLFIYNGINHDRFLKSHALPENVFDDKSTAVFSKRFAIAMALLISAILLDVIFLITITALLQSNVIKAQNISQAQCYTVAAFLTILAPIVGGIVYYGIQRSKYDAASRAKKPPSKCERISEAVCGVIMTVSTILFFILGFVVGYWSKCWISFLVGGMLCGIVSIIVKAVENNKK